MDQRADGYFLNPVPAPEAPEPDAGLATYRAWRAAGLASYSLAVRGGTHLEWVDVPYILTSTTYGVRLADAYTFAWNEGYTAATGERSAGGAAQQLEANTSETDAAAQTPAAADTMRD